MLSRTVKIHRKRICGPKISIAKKTSTVLGFDGGGLSLDTQYNGTVVGIDLYQKDNTTAGAAIAYADGNSSSSDGGAYTRNDATYLGASLYGLKDLGAIVWQRISPMWAAAMTSSSTMQAKSSLQNWILGVKAMKDYDLGEGILTPYAGLCYLRLTTDSST